jgi:hypothetical protein
VALVEAIYVAENNTDLPIKNFSGPGRGMCIPRSAGVLVPPVDQSENSRVSSQQACGSIY